MSKRGKRRAPGVKLPASIQPVRKTRNGKLVKIYYYFQERRNRPDAGPRIPIPYELTDPRFWQAYESLKTDGAVAKAGTFGALIDAYKASHRYTKLAKNSRDTYDIALGHIRKRWGDLPVCDVQPKHAYALQEALSDRPSMANLTVCRVLKLLLKHGIRAGFCETNIARDIEPLDEAGVGAEPWSEEAFAYVLQHAPALLMRAAVLGRATGQRAVDLVRMRPADRAGDGINMVVRKLGNEPHWCPLTREAAAAIDGWREERMMPYLNLGGRRISEDRLRAEWKAFKALHSEHLPEDITLHDLRASAVCDRRIAGVPHQQICDQLRMSPGMVAAYSKHIDRRLNATAGMKTMERAENAHLKTIYAAIENRKS